MDGIVIIKEGEEDETLIINDGEEDETLMLDIQVRNGSPASALTLTDRPVGYWGCSRLEGEVAA